MAAVGRAVFNLSCVDNKLDVLPETTRFHIYSYLDVISLFALRHAFNLPLRDLQGINRKQFYSSYKNLSLRYPPNCPWIQIGGCFAL